MALYACRLLARRWLGDDTFELTISRPDQFDYQPGQRIELHQGDIARAYSLVSAPGDPELRLSIARVAGGKVSPWLAEAEPGTPLHFSGPFGYFLFHPSPHPAVFVATGTGIAPFVSMVRSGVRNVTLMQGATTAEQAYYGQWLAARVARYRACLSGRSKDKPHFTAFSGRVTDYIEQRLSDETYHFYISGRPAMVRDVVRIVDARFPDAKVRMEMFS